MFEMFLTNRTMKKITMIIPLKYLLVLPAIMCLFRVQAQVGVGTKAPEGAETFLDGTRAMLDAKWIYWNGPRLAAKPPIKWEIVPDPVDAGNVLDGNDPTAAGGKYGTADIVTKKTFRDFRLHVEFLIRDKGGNSGVYLQNRYEIQVLDGDSTVHGMAAVINETPSPYYAYRGTGKWNAYDIVFRAARFTNGKRSEKAMLSMCFNGQKVHVNQTINKVWGGPNSGIDGGNEDGLGITDIPGGLKLQAEGHHVLYRNIWIQDLDLPQPETDLFEEQIPLWSDGAPGFEKRRNEPEEAKDWWVKNIHNPSITAFFPPAALANGAAVVICPGGGHRALVYNSEGRDAARYFNSIGVTAFVLKYRLFREEKSPYTEENTRQDAFRAMRLVRSKATAWKLDPKRIGIMGFSAGGELAAWASFETPKANNMSTDPVEHFNTRPDFLIGIYPGPLAVPESVSRTAPPAFLVAANDDECCSEPVLKLAQLYRSAKVPVEVHLFAQGNHAFNMGNKSTLATIKSWSQRLTDWMKDGKLLERK
jgi:acetyl esterase/lipase